MFVVQGHVHCIDMIGCPVACIKSEGHGVALCRVMPSQFMIPDGTAARSFLKGKGKAETDGIALPVRLVADP